MQLFFIFVLVVLLTVPFPFPSEPEAVKPKAVYEGFDTNVGIIAAEHGVIGAGSNRLFFLDEKGLVKKSLTSHPSKLRFLVQNEKFELAVFTSLTALTLFEIRRNDNDISLSLRCEAEIKDELVGLAKIASGELIGFKTESGGLLLSSQNCKFKKFDGNFILGLPLDTSSGIPFVHNGSTYIAHTKQGEIEVVKISVYKSPCDKPVSKDGYVVIPVNGQLAIASLSLKQVKYVAHDVCGESDEIFISDELNALFFPIDDGYALYKLSTASKRWEHPVPGTANLLGLFANDLFWAFSFEREGKNYVNLFRFNHKSAQLYGRYPLESGVSGRFAWSDKGYVALELGDRLIIYESFELKPMFSVRLSAPILEIVSYNGTFYALESSGKLLVIPSKK